MQRLSIIINEIYRKFLPIAENSQVKLSLDFPDTTQTTNDPEALKAELEAQLNSALSHAKGGEITISVRKNQIRITDVNTVLSKPICTLLSGERVQVKSRVGFGTTITINLTPTESSN